MTRLILIRHGETDWNIEGRWQGQADVPLNQRGREQAVTLARSLSGMDIAVIYSSDLARALDTARALAQELKVEISVDVRLREIHQGKWQGMLSTDIQQKYAREFQKRRDNPLTVAPPGGETVLQVMERAVSAIEDINHKHANETVAVVSHGFVIACLLTHYQNLSIEQVWNLIPENGAWQKVLLESESKMPQNIFHAKVSTHE